MRDIEPFHSWHTPIAWTGYILFVDGLVWKRRGNSWLSDARAEFLFLALRLGSALGGLRDVQQVFAIHNWYYVGSAGVAAGALLRLRLVVRDDLAGDLRDRRPGLEPARSTGAGTRASRRTAASARAAGWLSRRGGRGDAGRSRCSTRRSTWPRRSCWVSPSCSIRSTPRRARESILGDLREGRYGRLINLLIAGLVCGLLWEFWNYWAGAQWIYNVPDPAGAEGSSRCRCSATAGFRLSRWNAS